MDCHKNQKPLIIESFWDKNIISELTLTEDIYNNILHNY
ncbi:hypothetical protein CTDIVETGP_0828 [Clostridium tyrobutyricum DIVETGP]|uniref:Uncharacterized protein n=1 Tax=Clostridium tyrobutyricum DIVETGP TaxID=1408889 RepID=W6N2X9_CLOTY|nr:hypothetical protein CTK_C15020 [Clostridium tyrobutyricum]CDL90758.1 hypothetical protein CTDIVETGP_0828 [Clostridium tyrobutyricum DIVETGP]